MRRTFVKPFEDVRADGSVVLVDAPSFYRVRDGVLVIGNDGALEAEDGAAVGDAADLMQRFGELAHELEAVPVEEATDDETTEGLEDLGYTR